MHCLKNRVVRNIPQFSAHFVVFFTREVMHLCGRTVDCLRYLMDVHTSRRQFAEVSSVAGETKFTSIHAAVTLCIEYS